MTLRTFHYVVVLSLLAAVTIVSAKDIAGSSDHDLVGRYEGAQITRYVHKDYDQLAVPKQFVDYRDKQASYQITLTGKLTSIEYVGPAGRSILEVISNLQSALTEKSFTTVFECRTKVCGDSSAFYNAARGQLNPGNYGSTTYALMNLGRPEGNVWVALYGVEQTSGGKVIPHLAVHVVEEKAMETGKVTVVESSALKQSIDQFGKVAVYGIYFDVDKAQIKPDSESQIVEIAKLLQQNPQLSVLVVGHTDATGSLQHNKTLSEQRAQAVVAQLIKQHSIAAGRLFATGVGPAAPVASNHTEAGRAKNRRVEIVELLNEQ